MPLKDFFPSSLTLCPMLAWDGLAVGRVDWLPCLLPVSCSMAWLELPLFGRKLKLNVTGKAQGFRLNFGLSSWWIGHFLTLKPKDAIEIVRTWLCSLAVIVRIKSVVHLHSCYRRTVASDHNGLNCRQSVIFVTIQSPCIEVYTRSLARSLVCCSWGLPVMCFGV